MTIAKIRAALEKHLTGMSPALSTAFENAAFTPAPGAPYQRINLLPNTPDNSTMGAAVYFEIGLFQITVCYPQGVGPAAAEARAQAVRDRFKRGTSLTEAGVTAIVTSTPRVSPALLDGDRYCIPVSVPYQAQIET